MVKQHDMLRKTQQAKQYITRLESSLKKQAEEQQVE